MSSTRPILLLLLVLPLAGQARTEKKPKPPVVSREVTNLQAMADQGDALAQYNLALRYYFGRGVAQDYAKAMKWYRKAADQGNALAQYCVGNGYYHGEGVAQDYAEAVKWYRKAADQGDALAQYNLGNCYYVGHGVPLDQAEAVKWYRKAAEQGAVLAQMNLGNCYSQGVGIAQNSVEAVKWLRKAAEQGNALAQANLGAAYYNSHQDYAEAYVWFSLSASNGNTKATKYTDFAASKLTPRALEQAQARARKLQAKMAALPPLSQ